MQKEARDTSRRHQLHRLASALSPGATAPRAGDLATLAWAGAGVHPWSSPVLWVTVKVSRMSPG